MESLSAMYSLSGEQHIQESVNDNQKENRPSNSPPSNKQPYTIANLENLTKNCTSFDSTSNGCLPSRVEQLEREKREITLQLKMKDEKERALKARNLYIEEALAKLETQNERYEKLLALSQHEHNSLQKERDNLANEVRKLTKQQNTSSHDSGQSLWGQMTAASRELCRAEEEVKSLQREMLELKEKNTVLLRQQEKAEMKELAHERTLQELVLERKNKAAVESELEISLKDNADISARLANMDASFARYRDTAEETISRLTHELEQANEKIETLQKSNSINPRSSQCSYSEWESNRGSDISGKRKFSDATDNDYDDNAALYIETISELRERLVESERKRRKLHNKIQDLKGSVRVFVRCRPFLPSDGEDAPQPSLICNAEGTTVTLSEQSSRGAGQVFQFDQVYNQNSRQEDVFADISDLVQSSLDGYRVCVFSYGQTGSGKTHTMTGSTVGNDRGLIPRSIELMISQITSMREMGWDVTATYSMLEVYNETLIDLLEKPDTTTSFNTTATKNKLKIGMVNERVVVNGLTSVPMETGGMEEGMRQLQEILREANSSRTVASTAMNERSSRSHVLFMMDIRACHSDGTSIQGGLRLVDLAGSERLDRTGTLTDAARLRETVNINKSLSCLGDVFMALGNKSSHVPYRNSKLTMLLQDCLSGDGKTLMLVNVSPTSASSHETFCSLKFASQVNQVQLGAARKNITIAPKIIQQTVVSSAPSLMSQTSGLSVSSNVSSSPTKISRQMSKAKSQYFSSSSTASECEQNFTNTGAHKSMRTKRQDITDAGGVKKVPIRKNKPAKVSGWR